MPEPFQIQLRHWILSTTNYFSIRKNPGASRTGTARQAAASSPEVNCCKACSRSLVACSRVTEGKSSVSTQVSISGDLLERAHHLPHLHHRQLVDIPGQPDRYFSLLFQARTVDAVLSFHFRLVILEHHAYSLLPPKLLRVVDTVFKVDIFQYTIYLDAQPSECRLLVGSSRSERSLILLFRLAFSIGVAGMRCVISIS